MKIYCPHCGVKGSADDSYSGRTIKCPKCEEMFALTDDMAIDQNEFLTADLRSEGLTETVPEDGLQEENGLDLDSPVAALSGSDEEHIDETLDLSDDLGDAPEPIAAEVESDELFAEEEGSLDWGDFGAELDKEIADSEAEDVTGDLLETNDFLEEDGPIASQGDSDDSLSLDDFSTTEDDALAGDLGDILRGDREEAEDVLEEVSDENTDIDEEITDTLAAEDDEITETLDIVETIEDTLEEDVDNNLATLTAPEVVMPLFVDDDTDEDESSEVSDEELTDELDSAEVMEFADTDLPDEDLEVEEEPDVIIGGDSDDVVVVEDEPYGFDKEQCWQCGKKDSVGEPFIAVDGRLYCTDCLPAEEVEEDGMSAAYAAAAGVTGAAAALGSSLAGDEDVVAEEVEVSGRKKKFTVGGVIRESWEKVKGIKTSIWAGSALMYLVLIVIIAGGGFLLPETTLEPEGGGVTTYLLSALFQVLTEVVSMLFIAGLLFMGIRHVAGDNVSWKMIFHGFSFTGKIIVVSILQFILVTIGFLLLILPGIYLFVGYAMAIPLIVDKNLSPWQALETSRKAVHKVWWKVAALYIVMILIFLVALIPLGIGLIWAWPMMMVVAGVVYHRLFRK